MHQLEIKGSGSFNETPLFVLTWTLFTYPHAIPLFCVLGSYGEVSEAALLFSGKALHLAFSPLVTYK